jgi:hypothetical protein
MDFVIWEEQEYCRWQNNEYYCLLWLLLVPLVVRYWKYIRIRVKGKAISVQD